VAPATAAALQRLVLSRRKPVVERVARDRVTGCEGSPSLGVLRPWRLPCIVSIRTAEAGTKLVDLYHIKEA
jgi:hypothetical protein